MNGAPPAGELVLLIGISGASFAAGLAAGGQEFRPGPVTQGGLGPCRRVHRPARIGPRPGIQTGTTGLDQQAGYPQIGAGQVGEAEHFRACMSGARPRGSAWASSASRAATSPESTGWTTKPAGPV